MPFLKGRVARLSAALGGLSLALLAIDLAPAVLGSRHPVSVVARSALASTCHQDPARCLEWRGAPLAACARCTGLHASGLLLAALALVPRGFAALARVGPARLALAGCSPLVVDALAGMAFAAWDHPGLRLATGLVAGAACLAALVVRTPATPSLEAAA